MSEIETLHVPFADYLRRHSIPFVNARPDVPAGIATGWPDFTLLLGGRALCIEFKTKDGTLSKAQRDRHAQLAAAGNLVLVLRDLGRAIAVVDAWRATIGEIQPTQATHPGAAAEPEERMIGGSIYRLNRATGRWDFARLATAAEPRAAQIPPA